MGDAVLGAPSVATVFPDFEIPIGVRDASLRRVVVAGREREPDLDIPAERSRWVSGRDPVNDDGLVANESPIINICHFPVSKSHVRF
ncbi:hypothetical protein HBNXHx_1740 [Haloferax volcanii]|nr:hypothetical protein HBNXHx_1740 [Haloferax alexandrinus]